MDSLSHKIENVEQNKGGDTIPPLFSVLMAVYNAQPYLEDALKSMQCQTCPSWELICVDDASTDDSLEILERYAAADERIKFFSKSVNQGQAIARNEALTYARGAYVVMLDADDWLSEDCLESVRNSFMQETDSVVLRLVQYHQENGHEELYETPYKASDVLSGHDAFVASLDWTLHGLYAVRRELHLRYPYDTSCHLYSDDNTTRLHYLHSREVRFCQGTYFYRKHEKSATSVVSADRFLYMQANLSMHKTLVREHVEPEILQFYERHRWLNYIDQLWLYSQYKNALTSNERQQIEASFREIYSTFSDRPVPVKFGYTRLRCYELFRLQEHLYFLLRRIMHK